MSCQYSLLFLFLCGFAAHTVSTKTCGRELLEGTSCTIKLPTKNTDTSGEIIWTHLSSGAFILRSTGKIRTNTPDLTVDEDGSLTFKSASLNNTGKYRYTVFNAEGSQIDAGEKEMNVYAKAPKPTVMFGYDDGYVNLTCDTGDRTDLTVSWYKEGKIIQNEKNPKLLLTSAQVQENEPYSCSVSNPVSNEESNSVTVSLIKTCGKELLEGTSCTIQLPRRNNEKPNEIRWINLSSGDFIHRSNGTIKTSTTGLTVEEDGSLTFESVSLKNTGKYRYTVFNAEGSQIDAGEKEIKVYAKAPKPNLTFQVMSMLSCDIGKRTDLTVSWYVDGKIIQNEKNPILLLISAQVQQNKPYSCTASNPVSSKESDSMTISQKTELVEF
ncbi:carcinoembryonic antigen-related cell adhesion molecule 5-like [Onychostoma macrolepis]|uniref:carcinoembryonic antigen-related cell adhesion molecule 5-like n=1 Tax=Onychostoma macrolepis TaxID=369639 RepID=UPI00272C686A|nr:carcinoembryonic antigen-related cell adhesion molecule 5-like [Onychostoma macrolepis]